MSVSELVRTVIRGSYPAERESDIAAMLEAIPLSEEEAWARTRDRVQLAVLLLAAGDLERLRATASLAARDWRDALVAAGLENEDWPEVLRLRGLPVP